MTKRLILLQFLLVSLVLASHAQIQNFEWDGVQRQYIAKMPTEHAATVPVMFFLHGLGDNITRLDSEFNFSEIANEFGWLVVAPQALNEGNGTMWNAGLMNSNIDDSGFLMALLDSLAVQYAVDLDSVFFTGFSMGGFMTHRMAIEHGDRITACAPVSGLITTSMSAQTPVAPVRMLHIHGTNDPVVGYNGYSQVFGSNLGLGVYSILNYWIEANQCVNEAVVDTFPDLKNDGLLFVRYTYEGEADLQHIKVVGGNHTWYHSADQYDIGYMDEIYEFFKGNNDGNTHVGSTYENGSHIWPNPTRGLLQINTESASTVEVIDLQGRILKRENLQQGVNHVDIGDLADGLYFVRMGECNVEKVLLKR